jgi:ribose 5-phosphate isomerase B
VKIALGADHRGFALKENLRAFLQKAGYQTVDLGTESEESVDYPDFAMRVGQAVASGQADQGIAVCWSGNGMMIAANKVKGVRAALALNPEMAQLAREHNDANILTLAAKYVSAAEAMKIVEAWLKTSFAGGRHTRRVEKIKEAERVSG